MTDPKQRLSDAEIICTWMEPSVFSDWEVPTSSGYGWWRRSMTEDCDARTITYGDWQPRPLTLDALHEVEARLTEEQVARYATELVKVLPLRGRDAWVWHASAEQKTKALAQVLRPIVEG